MANIYNLFTFKSHTKIPIMVTLCVQYVQNEQNAAFD